MASSTVFNPFTKKLDFVGSGSSSSFNGVFGSGGFTMTSPDGRQWIVTIDNTGTIVTTLVSAGSGQPVGLLLVLTRP